MTRLSPPASVDAGVRLTVAQGTAQVRRGVAAVAADAATDTSHMCRGVGCGMVLDIARGPDGRRRAVKASGDKAHPANAGRLCTKGATSADLLAAPGRLGTALVRAERGAAPVERDVGAVLIETARRLRAIIDEHGPDAFAMYVSGQMTLEAQYLANKLVKGFISTNQIESNSRRCMASAGTGYKLSLHGSGPAGSACGVPLLRQARDLGGVRWSQSDGVLELSVFKFRVAITERVQTTPATQSSGETKGQARGSDEFSAPTGCVSR